MIDLDAVFIVITLAQQGSLARASRVLGLPRTTLSRRVAQLEEQLGVRLVERNQRHLRLTESGQLLVKQGAQVLDVVRHFEAALQAGPQVRLRVALPPGFGWDLVAPVLPLDDALTAGVGFELFHADREVHPIRDDFDLVASFAPPTDSTLYCRSFLRFPWRCVATPAYLAEHGTPRKPADLATHACIALRSPGGVSPFQWPLRAGGTLQMNPRFLSNNIHDVLMMAVAGRGIAMLPDMPSASTPLLVPVLAEHVGADGELYLTMGQRLSESQRGRRLKLIIERTRTQMLANAGAADKKRRRA